jgi:hypothetical protein
VVPRSLPSNAFTVAVVGCALAGGFGGSWTPEPAPAAPTKVTYEIHATVSSDSIDLHRVAWGNVTLPGRACGVRAPVRLRDGKATVDPHLEVNAGWHRVVYGDLDFDRRDEAAVSVACSNGGGTADSVWAYAVVLFKAGASAPIPVAVIRPQHHVKRMPATLLQVTIRPRRVRGREAFYGRNDGTCCPSGRAVSTWVYARGRLKLAGTRVTREPS